MVVVASDEQRDFFVWVPPENWLVKHNLGLIGAFVGGPLNGNDDPKALPFQPNAIEYNNSLSPFHLGVMNYYRLEYVLDVERWDRYRDHPSRLHALFLLESEEAAQLYRETHPAHVAGRILKRATTAGSYRYSIHDSGWIEFLRLPHSLDRGTLRGVASAYWEGERIDQATLTSMGKPWNCPTSMEVLFYGRVNFLDKEL